eukprot:m.271079 g.271079  ORF g.271079 m.271079 type:complete len:56 (+) comp16266_c0_seq39:1696-1863(+)
MARSISISVVCSNRNMLSCKYGNGHTDEDLSRGQVENTTACGGLPEQDNVYKVSH